MTQDTASRWNHWLAMAAAGLMGLGAIFWVAAHWASWDRTWRFGLVEGWLVIAGGIATLAPGRGLRVPAAFAALLAIGALLALLGQTYPTGAPAWQLFALWAVAGLPLSLAARHDAIWAAWAGVAMTAVTLALLQRGVLHVPAPARVVACGAAAAAIVGALGPRAARWTGAGITAGRTAAVLASLSWTLGGLSILSASTIEPPAELLHAIELAFLAGAAWWASRPASWDLMSLSVFALGLDVLLVVRFGDALSHLHVDEVVTTFGVACFAAGVLAATVSAVLRVSRARARAPARGTVRGASDASPAMAGVPDGADADDAADAADAALRPWPVVLLSALGAWLVAVPLLIVISLLLGNHLSRDAGAVLVGLALSAVATFVLRQRAAPVFVEQMMVPMLLAGLAEVAIGVASTAPGESSLVVVSGVALVAGAFIGRRWLQALLGAVAAIALAFACFRWLHPDLASARHATHRWMALHVLAAAWALAWWSPPRKARGRADGVTATTLDAMALGWGVATLLALAALSGMTFLMPGALGSADGGWTASGVHDAFGAGPAAASAVLALLAGAIVAAADPRARAGTPGITQLGAALASAFLAWWLPFLGATLAIGAAFAVEGRRVPAGVAAAAALWIVGSFYYALGWPLATKAAALGGVGAALAMVCGAVALLERKKAAGPVAAGTSMPAPPWPQSPGRAMALGPRAGTLAIAVSTVGTLAFVAVAARAHQAAIDHGELVIAPLAPVDPRSLMQGDYLRIAFAVPRAAPDRAAARMFEAPPDRVQVVVRLDARHVATLLRWRLPGEALAPDQRALDLRPGDVPGNAVIGTDQWFIPEGQGARYAAARYARLRVTPAGMVQMTGVMDAELRPIDP